MSANKYTLIILMAIKYLTVWNTIIDFTNALLLDSEVASDSYPPRPPPKKNAAWFNHVTCQVRPHSWYPSSGLTMDIHKYSENLALQSENFYFPTMEIIY